MALHLQSLFVAVAWWHSYLAFSSPILRCVGLRDGRIFEMHSRLVETPQNPAFVLSGHLHRLVSYQEKRNDQWHKKTKIVKISFLQKHFGTAQTSWTPICEVWLLLLEPCWQEHFDLQVRCRCFHFEVAAKVESPRPEGRHIYNIFTTIDCKVCYILIVMIHDFLSCKHGIIYMIDSDRLFISFYFCAPKKPWEVKP